MVVKKVNGATGLSSIGQTVERLKKDYPGLSISKVRYLEDEGLLKPQRTKGGYRLFSVDDVGRLEEILKLQQEQFLPLAVIKERMKHWRPGVKSDVDAKGNGESTPEAGSEAPIKLVDLIAQTGLGGADLKALESFGLIGLKEKGDDSVLSREDAEIMRVFSQLIRYGIEARHLRMYENLAQRESLLFQQILTPQIKHKSQALRQKSRTDLRELIELTDKMRRVILEKSLKEARLV